MGDNDDGVILFQFHCQIFDAGSGDGVQRGSGLVHQQDGGFHCQSAGDAKPLLLTTGHSQGILLQTVLDFVPDCGTAQGLFHDVIQLCLVGNAVGTGTVGNIIVNAHGKWVGFLEHHAHFLAQIVYIGIENILTIVCNLTGDLHRGNQVVHPVQGL